MSFPPVLLANLILFFHLIFINLVVFSVPLILAGGFRRWAWVRNPWFRFGHLGMIGFVVLESVIGMHCPLTVWESALRTGSGGAGYGEEGFIAHFLHSLLFYDFPSWVFTLLYTAFGLLVASLFYFVPVRFRGA